MCATYIPVEDVDEPPYMRLVQDRVPEGEPIRPPRRELCATINTRIFCHAVSGRQCSIYSLPDNMEDFPIPDPIYA